MQTEFARTPFGVVAQNCVLLYVSVFSWALPTPIRGCFSRNAMRTLRDAIALNANNRYSVTTLLTVTVRTGYVLTHLAPKKRYQRFS